MNNLVAGLISLGCSKNQVDSEMVLGYLRNKGIEISNDTEKCDIIIVNTCGFINSAKEESINTIFEMHNYKESGKCKYLVVIGCLAKRYKDELIKEIPEIDMVISLDDYDRFDEYMSSIIKKENTEYIGSKFDLEYENRIISTSYPVAYLKISDGCDNRCTYCTIPMIRGSFKSRPIEDILSEAEKLVEKGIRELIVISQDTSRHGLDIYGEYRLAELLDKLSNIEKVHWVRVLYMYPTEISDKLLDMFKEKDKIVPYFDIPIQHLNDKILKDMNRRGTKKEIIDLIEKIRTKIPEAIIRTTIIVGFPGETEDDFNELITGIKDIKFDRLGAFAFSREEDTVAYNLKNQVDDTVKENRLKELMSIQKDISNKINKSKIGKTYEVLIEDISSDEKYFTCRSYAEAPDVDNKIYIPIDSSSIVGGFYLCEIDGYSEYDLFGKIIGGVRGE